MVLLGTLHSSFGAVIETSAGLPLRIHPQIGDKPRLESCVVSQVVVYTHAGFRLKVAEIHDVYMALSGGNMCEEVHPCRVIKLFE
jgi:hypothetical protein